MLISPDTKLDFKDVLICPQRSNLTSRSEVCLTRKFKFKHSKYELECLPIIAANMDGVGTIEMYKEFYLHNMQVALTKHYSAQELIDFYDTSLNGHEPMNPIYSLGITEADLNKYVNVRQQLLSGKFYNHGIRIVCIDVANGYTEKFIEFCRQFRKDNPNVILIAGNVCTPEITQELILAGVDIVKIGIGPGSVCTTRKMTGIGYPQLSAIIECANAAHGLGGHIIADGGCTNPGDICKAFAAGADFVMLGGMLAGHDEGGGKVINKENKLESFINLCLRKINFLFNISLPQIEVESKQFIEFYGMSSSEAQKKHGEGLKEYRASEGKLVRIPYKGPVSNTIQNILGGLRSCCTYVGAATLKELPKRAYFVKVSQQKNDIYGTE